MRLFLDTANQEQIDIWRHYVDGVTVNPSLLKDANISTRDFYLKNREYFNNIFIQVNNMEDVNIIDASHSCIYKVPMVLDNIELIKKLKKNGARVCATTVYDIFQFNMACLLECDFSIVLHHKNEDDQFLKKCVYLKEDRKFKTQIIAASFRTKKEVNDAIIIGADCATIPPAVLSKCFENKNAFDDCRSYIESV